MCTLSFIPLGNNDFIFTTNRDEKPDRKALLPDFYQINGVNFLYPKDKEGNGTWMLCSEKQYSLCLLNGAFEKHEHLPPYKKSRGLVVLEFSEFLSSRNFVLNYDFSGIEAFTLVVLRYENSLLLEEIRWDGCSIHFRVLNPLFPRIWSSATLYNNEAKIKRERWFTSWLQEANFTSESVLNFHKSAGGGDVINGLLMNRKNLVRTTSITQITRENGKVLMYFEDVLNNESVTKSE